MGGITMKQETIRQSLKDAVTKLLIDHGVSRYSNEFFDLIHGSIVEELRHIPASQEESAMNELTIWFNYHLETMAKNAGSSTQIYVSKKMSSCDRKDVFIKIISAWRSQRKYVKDVLNALEIPKEIPCRKALVSHFNSEVGVVPLHEQEKTMAGILSIAKKRRPITLEEIEIKAILSISIREWQRQQ
jgi:hypothetical protein